MTIGILLFKALTLHILNTFNCFYIYLYTKCIFLHDVYQGSPRKSLTFKSLEKLLSFLKFFLSTWLQSPESTRHMYELYVCNSLPLPHEQCIFHGRGCVQASLHLYPPPMAHGLSFFFKFSHLSVVLLICLCIFSCLL